MTLLATVTNYSPFTPTSGTITVIITLDATGPGPDADRGERHRLVVQHRGPAGHLHPLRRSRAAAELSGDFHHGHGGFQRWSRDAEQHGDPAADAERRLQPRQQRRHRPHRRRRPHPRPHPHLHGHAQRQRGPSHLEKQLRGRQPRVRRSPRNRRRAPGHHALGDRGLGPLRRPQTAAPVGPRIRLGRQQPGHAGRPSLLARGHRPRRDAAVDGSGRPGIGQGPLVRPRGGRGLSHPRRAWKSRGRGGRQRRRGRPRNRPAGPGAVARPGARRGHLQRVGARGEDPRHPGGLVPRHEERPPRRRVRPRQRPCDAPASGRRGRAGDPRPRRRRRSTSTTPTRSSSTASGSTRRGRGSASTGSSSARSPACASSLRLPSARPRRVRSASPSLSSGRTTSSTSGPSPRTDPRTTSSGRR